MRRDVSEAVTTALTTIGIVLVFGVIALSCSHP